MTCGPCCNGHDATFGEGVAQHDLRRFRRRGPPGPTRWLLDALRTQDLADARLLDVGGGVGAIPFTLFEAGIAEADAVDASPAYLAAAAEEAGRRGVEARFHPHLGDATEVAPTLPPAEVVTLDRALCCYARPGALIDATAPRAERLYGVVYPRRTLWTRLGIALANGLFRLQRSGMRVFAHDPAFLRQRIETHGFRRTHRHDGWVWRAELYRRS